MSEKLMYDTILARSFSRYEQKKFRYGAFICLVMLGLSFCTMFKSFLGPLPALTLQLSRGAGLKMLRVTESTGPKMLRITQTSNADMPEANHTSSSQRPTVYNTTNFQMPVVKDTSSSQKLSSHENVLHNNTSGFQELVHVPGSIIPKKRDPVCVTEARSDFCEVEGDARIKGKDSAVFIRSSESENSSWIIRPYARKGDVAALNRVKKWFVKLENKTAMPGCTKNHSVPAILFSLGGYSGNNFHDFTDIVIPLYLTSHGFKGEVKFLVTGRNPWWISKFQELIGKLSTYEVIDIDNEEDIHCFTRVIVGLKRPQGFKELTIDPSRSPPSMKDFRQFLKNTYSLKKSIAIKLRDGEKRRPRLLIITRKRTRAFTNAAQIAKMARQLGFEVVVTEADRVSRFAELVNTCDVMLGVHGAGLTNMVFLPENAILIQVLPIGGFEWLARTDFEEPAKLMNIRYLEYKIKAEESTLIQQYPHDHEVITNPSAISKQGWEAFKSIYLVKQNVNLDVNRLKPTLLKALELLHQ